MRYANKYGVCELSSMPGCTQTVISHSMFIYPKYRKQGFGSINMQLRIDRCKQLGYDYMICTVAKNNIAQQKLLNKFNFKELDAFKSNKTSNNVSFYGKKINN